MDGLLLINEGAIKNTMSFFSGVYRKGVNRPNNLTKKK
jgi:hypothetical protein